MNSAIRKDYTLGGEIAYDEDRKQQVVICYTWETVFKEGIVTIAEVIGRMDHEVYSTDLRNLSNIGAG